MKTAIINDLHLGVKRTGGTTPQSAKALRDWTFSRYKYLLELARDQGVEHILVNGDLTDRFDIDLQDALELYEITLDYLRQTGMTMTWALGNHDLSKDSSKLGSVQFIGRLLQAVLPQRFTLVDTPTFIGEDFYVIPHLTNQAEFDTALQEALQLAPPFLFLHCNYDNPFAGAADHSLNLSREQARAFKRKGVTVVLGHEHQGRSDMGDSVLVVGNQFPTSVADCLAHGEAQRDGMKYMLIIDNAKVERVCTWTATHSYAEVDWRELAGDPGSTSQVEWDNLRFIRVSGECSRDESSEAIKAISNLRKTHSAFVITNAVKVEGIADTEFDVSIEDIGAVDVVQLLYDMLSPEQVDKLRKLREARG